jgi:response regulator RpfG family c-di-GMP phosphodiesterase
MKQYKINPSSSPLVEIFLADDDRDDRFFFHKELKALPFHVQFTMIEDGENLLSLLNENPAKLPDVLFLDYNMPRKNGAECLSEIKSNPLLKALPVIMYSSHLHNDVVDLVYEMGAHFYLQKTNLPELRKILYYVINLIMEKKLVRPSRDQFVLSYEILG